MKHLLSLLGFVMFASSCESNEKKLARLENEHATECALEQAYYTKYSEARFPGGLTVAMTKNPPPRTPAIDSLGRQWSEHRTKCALAKRDYDRFMR